MDEKRFYIKIGNEKVAVSETLFKQYMKMQRQEQYRADRDKEKGLMYYDSWDAERGCGEEVCVDHYFNTEEQALAAIEAEKIWQCVQNFRISTKSATWLQKVLQKEKLQNCWGCLLYTSPSPRD